MNLLFFIKPCYNKYYNKFTKKKRTDNYTHAFKNKKQYRKHPSYDIVIVNVYNPNGRVRLYVLFVT